MIISTSYIYRLAFFCIFLIPEQPGLGDTGSRFFKVELAAVFLTVVGGPGSDTAAEPLQDICVKIDNRCY